MKKVRVIFETRDVARFISHLDLNRVMQYALRRSNLPIWYTEGFNQHIYLTFSNPLSLGFLNKCGIMEIKLTEDNFDAALVSPILDKCLPESIRAVESYESERKFTEIAFSDYLIEFETVCTEKISATLKSPELIAIKKGKGGETEINLAPYIKGLNIESDGDKMTVKMRLPASVDFNVNPKLLMDTVGTVSGEKLSHMMITRLDLLDKDGKKFR